MQYKTTKKLFMGTYQYKVVLVCACSGMFRGNDLEKTKEILKNYDVTNLAANKWSWGSPKTQADIDYANDIVKVLDKLENYTVRVETPWLSIYSNSTKDLDKIVKTNESAVKYYCIPPANGLTAGTVIMPKINFEFKVTLSKTTQSHVDFVEWAENNNKIKLTKRCIKDLSRNKSWGGSHFYINGEKTLLLAKMQLSSCIGKVERILSS